MTSAGFNWKIWEVEDKIPDVSDLVKRTECDAKIKKTSREDTSIMLIIINI